MSMTQELWEERTMITYIEFGVEYIQEQILLIAIGCI
jgi:hypothetical protein